VTRDEPQYALPRHALRVSRFDFMKKYLSNLVYVLSNILFTVVTFSWSNRVLGVDVIGKAQTVLTLAQYFVLIAAIGIPIYGVVEVAKVAKDKIKLSKLFSELVVINFITTAFMLVVYLAVIFLVKQYHHDLRLFLIGGGLVFISFTTIEWYYTGSEQFRFLAFRTLVIRSISLIALIALVRTQNDLVAYLSINVLTIVATNIWYLFNLRGKVNILFKDLDLRRHIPALLILWTTTMTVCIYTFGDVLLVGFLAGDHTVGLYTAAIKLNKMVIPIIISLATVLIPGISRSIAGQDKLSLEKMMDSSFAFICLLGIPVSAGLLVFAPEFLMVFTGPKFGDAKTAMQITAGLAFVIGLGNIFGLQLLIPGGFRKQYLIATLVGVGLSLVLNTLLIGPYGQNGAAVAMMAAETGVAGVSFYYIRKRIPIKFNWTLVVQAIGICLLFLPVAWLVRSWDTKPLIRLLVAVTSCAGLYFAILIFVLRERHLLELIQRKWR